MVVFAWYFCAYATANKSYFHNVIVTKLRVDGYTLVGYTTGD